MGKKSQHLENKIAFDAVLENSGAGLDIAYVSFPFDVAKIFGTRGMVKVKATFNGHAYRGVLANMGHGAHQIGVRKDIRKAIGKNVGDSVHVTVEKDTDERVVDMPADLLKVLSKNNTAKAFYETLSYTNRKEYSVWITSAKKDETRKKRLGQILEKLLDGKKNPGDK